MAELHTEGHVGALFEFYAQVMEINHWTSTEFTKGEWDAEKVLDRDLEDGRRQRV